MPTILDELAAAARQRVDAACSQTPYKIVRSRAEQAADSDCDGRFRFESAIRDRRGEPAFICEVKKASPSKGIISHEFPYIAIAEEYEAAGATAISVLTEPTRFLGADTYLSEIAKKVSLPLLRKDFTVDAYQIYEAKLLGAAAVLLISSLLSREQLKEYLSVCHELGMSALVETRDKAEIEIAMWAGARIIGINNRNLDTFEVDTDRSTRLRDLVPRDILFVAESGIKSAADVRSLREIGADAVLVGETLMLAGDKVAMFAELKGDADAQR